MKKPKLLDGEVEIGNESSGTGTITVTNYRVIIQQPGGKETSIPVREVQSAEISRGAMKLLGGTWWWIDIETGAGKTGRARLQLNDKHKAERMRDAILGQKFAQGQ